MKCPINYYQDNLIFNIDRSCWAAFRLIGYDYDFLDDESKIALLYKSARFLSGLISKAQILIIPMEQNNKEHFKKLRGRIKKTDPLYDAASNHARDTEIYIERSLTASGDVNDYRFYLIAKLKENNPDFMDTFRDAYQYFIKDPINAINVIMNTDTKDILQSKIRKCVSTADKFWASQSKKMNMEPIHGEELQMLFRRMAFRGINDPLQLFYSDDNFSEWHPMAEEIPISKHEKLIRPYGRDIVNLFSGTISSRNRSIIVKHSTGKTSYQTFLVITHLPDSLEFPGSEWLYMLQKYNTQAEVCISLDSIEYKESLHNIDLKKREITSQMGNVAEAGSRIPETLIEGQEYADALESEVRTYREPILHTSIAICLAADSMEKLEAKVMTIKEAYEDMQFTIERPVADQIKLYMQFIPSVGNMISDYIMPLTPLCLAGGIIGAVHELGDKAGPFIGTTGAERKPVYLDLGQAPLRNKSASATFFGNLGVGKSFNANLLLFLNILYGGYGLIFDPKGERSHWVKDFHILKDMITLVSLSASDEFKGKLDPYNIYRDDIDTANELALNIIAELFRISPTSEEYTALLTAAKQLKDESQNGSIPSMLRLAAILENFDKKDELCRIAASLARRLRLQEVAGMSTLLFGDGTEEAITLDNRLNILQIQNLKLPSPETQKADYTNEELLSTVIMMVLANFAKKFALVKRPVFKIVLFDESWALGKTAEGVKLYDYLTRMGRSLFTGIIFNGHSVLDIPTEGIKNTISYKFCFQTTNDNEAIRMCDYLGLESTEENKEVIKGLRNGECLFQDLDGHVGVLAFDAVFQDIIDIFSTTPTTEETTQDDNPKKDVTSNIRPEDLPGESTENSSSIQEAASGSAAEVEPDNADVTYSFTLEDLLTKENI